MTLHTEKTTVVVDPTGFAAAVNRSLNAKLQDAVGSRLLSRSEFCSMFNISVSTSERWARLGYGPRPIKIGPRRIGYRLSDVWTFSEMQQHAPA
jgi:predicted DNA-binding transcriptional regulator AlpA